MSAPDRASRSSIPSAELIDNRRAGLKTNWYNPQDRTFRRWRSRVSQFGGSRDKGAPKLSPPGPRPARTINSGRDKAVRRGDQAWGPTGAIRLENPADLRARRGTDRPPGSGAYTNTPGR